MLSALVGGGVSRGQQLPTSEAASFLLAQELCIRLRSRRVTRVCVPDRQLQPQAVRHGEHDRQVSVSEAATQLLPQELQVKRVTRTSIQSKPPDPLPNSHFHTHNLKSSGRTVRKLNYRRVANLGLVSSPDAGNKRRSTKPRKSELPATGEGRTESRFNQKKQASARWSREVGTEQRRRAGAVGKSDAVGRQSKPQSVVYPGSKQADTEVAPGTWSSTVTEVPLKAKIPQVHIQSCVHPGGLNGEDDSNRRTAQPIDESQRGVMDCYEGRAPTTDFHRETRCSPTLYSAERLFTPLAKEMCTENGTSSDTSERSICPKIPQCEAQAMHVGVEKARRVTGKGNSGGGNLKNVVIPFPSEKCLGIGSVHKVPLRSIVTSDVPDWVPSVPIATNALPTENDGTGVLACHGTLTQNGLPSGKAPVDGDPLAERRSPSKVLEGETASQHVGKDQPTDRSVDAAGDDATAAPSGVTVTVGPSTNALIKAPSEVKGGNKTLATSSEDMSACEISAGNQRVPDMLAGEETSTEWRTFGLSRQDKLAVPTIRMPTHFTPKNTLKPVHSAVVAVVPKGTVAKVSRAVSEDLIVESGGPSDCLVTDVLFGKSQLTDVSATPTAIMEASTAVELSAGAFYSLVADGELVEHELADIPTDVTGFATDIFTESDQAMEESVLVNKALRGGLQPGGVPEAAEATFRVEGVEYEPFADDELVDIPTDVISDVTEEEADYKVQPLGMTTASGEMLGNRYFPLFPDSIANNILGSTKATSSRDVFSVSEFSKLSLESSTRQEDENANVESVMSCSLTEEKPLYVMVDVESERMVSEQPFRKGFKGRVETQMSGEVSSVPPSQSKECKMSVSEEQDVCAHSGCDAVHCETNNQRAAELECIPRPISSTAQTLWLELEVEANIPNRCGQQSMEVKSELNEHGPELVNNATALPSARREVFGCRNKRKRFIRLKRRTLNSPVLFSNNIRSVSTLGKFCLSRTATVVQICRGVANCITADLYSRVQHVEEIKPKNLSLLPLNDLAPHKLSKRPLLVEHLAAIASGLCVFPSCTEIQQEFTASSKLASVGVNGRLQTKRIKDLPFCFAQEANSWGVDCHLTPRSLHAGVCRRVQSWFPSRHCKQSLHFSCPVLSNLDLFLLLSFISDGTRVDRHCVSERTNLSIIPQYWSQDWRTLPQGPPDCGQGLWPPASLVRAGKCCYARSRFGLHTVLALLSPACYRLWTRQRHFGRLSSAHRPLLTLFEEDVKRLIPLMPLNKPVWLPSCNVAGLVSCSQHITSACTSTSNVSPSDSWRHGRLANRPSSLPPCLLTGNTASLTEAKSLRLQLANKRSLLQHLSLSCIVEPEFALPDAPASSAACTVAESTFPTASSPIPSITYMETQLCTEQKEHPASTNKAVSKSKESLRKVSQIRIRKTIPKQDTNLTPMGLPKPKRLKKKEFSLEEIYTNQNYKSPSAHSKYLETIYEEPVLKKGSFVCTSLQKRKRLLEFQDYTLPRKRRAHAGVKVASRTRGRKASTREEEIDSLLVQKLTELEADLAGEGQGH